MQEKYIIQAIRIIYMVFLIKDRNRYGKFVQEIPFNIMQLVTKMVTELNSLQEKAKVFGGTLLPISIEEAKPGLT
jgi:hypothetical protein